MSDDRVVRVRFVESPEKYNYRLSINWHDLLLPIPLAHLEPIQECVCDSVYCSITRDFKDQDATATRTSREKVNLRSFSLHRDFSYSLTLSNVGEPNCS